MEELYAIGLEQQVELLAHHERALGVRAAIRALGGRGDDGLAGPQHAGDRVVIAVGAEATDGSAPREDAGMGRGHEKFFFLAYNTLRHIACYGTAVPKAAGRVW